MMACGCGKNCGPIIVRPEVDLGDVTVDTGPDNELRVLCDADGTEFLRRWSIAQDGTVTAVDTELDGTTSFTPVEPVGVCAPGQAGESPGEQCLHCQTFTLWDDGTEFQRTACRDCSGTVVSVEDATLDGDPYTVTGEVTSCCPDADESPGEPEPTQQAVVLCDDGTPFARTYVLAAGAVTGFADADLDGNPYAPAGTVGVCPAQLEESPAEPCGDTSVLPLCDTQPDGSVVQFLRHVTVDCDGQPTAVTDTELDGQTAYTPAGTVGVCPSSAPIELVEACDDTDADGEPDTRYVIAYRLDPTGATDPTPVGTFQPDLSAPYTPVAPISCCPDPVPPTGEPAATDTDICAPPNPPSGIVPLPGGGQALFDGGTLNVPADPDGSAGNGFRVNRAVAAALQADRPMCDDGTAAVTVSVQVCNDGPNPSPSDYAGSLCMFAPDCGGELLPHAFIQAPIGPGACQTLTSTVTVAAADLEAGNLTAVLDVSTFSEQGPRSWTIDSWQATYEYGTAGCANPEEGTGCCDQQVQKVQLCEPVTVKQGAEDKCASVIVEDRCDDVAGDGSEIVHYRALLCISPSGTVRELHTYRGSPTNYYSPGNPVPCGEPVPVTCGLDGEGVSGDTGAGTMTATDTPPLPYVPSGPAAPHVPLPGGGQPLWDGGSLTFPADPDGSAGDGDQVYRQIAAILHADRPTCDDGTVEVTASVRVTNDGPSAGNGYTGGFTLWSETTRLTGTQAPRAAAVGEQDTLTIGATVAAADLAAGRIVAVLELETHHAGPLQWTADQFQAGFTYGTEGCPDGEVPVQYVKICGPVNIGGGMLSAGGSSGGAGGAGGSATTGPQVVERCRCDDTTGDGIGDTEYVELWSVDPAPDGESTPALIGTFAADDLSQPYTPVNPVPCPADDGPAPAQPLVIHTGGGSSTSATAFTLDLAAAVPRLLSATITVTQAPAVVVNTSNGTLSIGPGASLTWSVQDNRNEQLDFLEMVVSDGTGFMLNFTYAD